jgi:hypothetical protein
MWRIKSRVKTIKISLLTLLFLVGCGSSSSDAPSKEDTTLDFNTTNATYDLDDYLQVNSIVTYKLTTYVDNSGGKKYAEENKVEIFPSQTNKRKSNVITMTNAKNIETGTITIFKNKFERIVKLGDQSIKFDVVRNFNVGDYITNSKMNQKISNATVQLNRTCKTTDTLESKKYNGTTYNNILEIKCTTTSTLTSKNELTTKADVEKNELIYMAKEKGIIYNESETCSSATNVVLNQESEVKVCTKTIQEVVSFTKN